VAPGNKFLALPIPTKLVVFNPFFSLPSDRINLFVGLIDFPGRVFPWSILAFRGSGDKDLECWPGLTKPEENLPNKIVA